MDPVLYLRGAGGYGRECVSMTGIIRAILAVAVFIAVAAITVAFFA